MVGAKGLGHEARQAQWAPKGHSRRRAQAGGHSAPHVDRPNRVQLVQEGGCRVTSNTETKGFLRYGRSGWRDLRDQLLADGVAEGIEVLRDRDERAGAADDVVAIVVCKPAGRVGVAGIGVGWRL